MKAIRVHATGGPDVLHLEEMPDPQPGPGEAVVRLEAIGVNVVEVFHRVGDVPRELPFTPGAEGAGIVVAVGEGVTHLRPGDRVTSESLQGSYAELAKAPAERLVRVPDGVQPAVAAAAMMRGITAHYLATTTYPLQPGDRCLVQAAAGGVGLLLCQIAKRRGAWVVGTTATEETARLVRDAGADEVMLYPRHDVAAEVRRLTRDRGVHVVYDSVGKDTFEESLDCLAPRGMMVICGQASGPIPPVDPSILARKGSLFLTRAMFAHYVAEAAELASRVSDLLRWASEGWLRVPLERTLPLADAADAHRALEAHRLAESRETGGKIVLVP